MAAARLSMLDRAQTFPRINKPITTNRSEAWMTADVSPYSQVEQKRVCYPALEPWCSRDGERNLGSEHEATIKDLKAKDGFLGLGLKLRERWSIKFEGANRRMEGSETAAVPTIMVVAWDENDRDYEVEDEDLWTQACGDMVTFLRENGVAYFGVEIIYWDKLDYQVVS
ncbi:uncharacterized protein GGS22DRAFT_130340 [Annulohypoxylon maeteangense]|uniref:uncharacterized protein n=1 Tax=Annulohypoxylon maeteangense TaxID=1927788 RepID=UPI002008DF04|nr:uncharacterized protein GGS22DRAFT_130340 [Annulohypoxylon maeteangense]KAI0885531.1 hypothetical protein GGS22DRAFT_130340 [Annulohypoxylon maeteangense]